MTHELCRFDEQLAKECASLTERWVQWQEQDACLFSSTDLDNFSAEQVVEFLERIFLLEEQLPQFKIEKMSTVYSMFEKNNCEIR